MKKILLSLFITGLFLSASAVLSPVRATPVAQAKPIRHMVVDVAFDGRTFALNPVNPAATALARGDTFVLNGKVYIGGTIPPGGTPDNPGDFSPDTPGSIANFICRGTSLFSDAEIGAGAAPFVATTQTFVFANGSTLVTEGLEAGVPMIRRAVTGGTHDFEGVQGEVTLELLGFNATGFENYRFTFRLKK